MFTPILASQLADSNIEWWWQIVFVPIAIGALSALLSLLGSVYLASKSEWYRRLTRWEPYGRELWQRQIALYPEVFKTARAALDVVTTITPEGATSEQKERVRKSRQDAFSKLSVVRIETAVLLPSEFSEVYGEFIAHLIALVVDMEKARSPEARQDLRRTANKAKCLYEKLLNLAHQRGRRRPKQEHAKCDSQRNPGGRIDRS